MYVYVRIYVYIYVYTLTYTYIHYMCIRTYVQYVHTYTCLCVCSYTTTPQNIVVLHMLVYVCMNNKKHKCACKLMCVCCSFISIRKHSIYVQTCAFHQSMVYSFITLESKFHVNDIITSSVMYKKLAHVIYQLSFTVIFIIGLYFL